MCIHAIGLVLLCFVKAADTCEPLVVLGIVGMDGDMVQRYIRSGVPVQKGTVFEGDVLGIRTEGTEWAAQWRSAAAWSDGSVRWVLLDVEMSSQTSNGKVTLCRYAQPRQVHGITITDNSDMVTIVTNTLQVEVPKTYGGVLHQVLLRDGSQLISPPEPGAEHLRGPWVITNGTFYGSLLRHDQDPPAPGSPMDVYVRSQDGSSFNNYHPYNLQVVVEDQNNITASVKVSGTHINADGDYEGTFITRLRFYRNGRYIKVTHTYVHTGDGTNSLLSGYGMRLPVLPSMTSTTLNGVVTAVEAELLQYSYSAYAVTNRNGSRLSRTAATLGTAGKSDGSAFVGVVLRDMARNHPKALLAEEEGIDVQLYPSSVAPWNLSNRCPTNNTNVGAQGVAKSSDYWLTFDSDELLPLALQAKAGTVMLMADPEWYSAAMGVGNFVFQEDLDSSVCKYQVGRALGVVTDFMKYNRQLFEWYGHDVYGGVRRSFKGNEIGSWTWDDEWSANAGDPLNALWVQYMRDQQRDTFVDAEAFSRHTMDLTAVHFGGYASTKSTPGTGGNSYHAVGSFHQHSCGPWGGSANLMEYIFVGGIETYYYMTGDNRAADVLYEAARFVERFRDPDEPYTCGLDVMTRAAQVFHNIPGYGALFRDTANKMLLDMPARYSERKLNSYLLEAAPALQYYYEVATASAEQLSTAKQLMFRLADDIMNRIQNPCPQFFYVAPLVFAAVHNSLNASKCRSAVTSCLQQYTHGDDVPLGALAAIPARWQDWNWSWSQAPSSPGLLWLDRQFTFNDNLLQGGHSYRMFKHIAVAAASADAKCVLREHSDTTESSSMVPLLSVIIGLLLCISIACAIKRRKKDAVEMGAVRLLNEEEVEMLPTGGISWAKLSCLEAVGEGMSGIVYKALYEVTKETVAVKEAKQTVSDNFTKEINLLCSLRQRDILTFYGWTEQDNKLYLITEYCAHGALTDFKCDISRERAALSLLGISRALAYIHDRGLVHLDVAARNVLVDDNQVFKLGDMGFMSTVGSAVWSPVPVAWSPPESFQERRIAQTTHDVWSFGCLVYEVLEGKQPFWEVGADEEGLRSIEKAIRQGSKPAKPDALSSLGELIWNKVVLSCWADSPFERCTMCEIITMLAAIEASPLVPSNNTPPSGAVPIMKGITQCSNPYVTLNVYGEPPERSESIHILL